ncbi:MAG: hypothetical protein ACI8RZ_007100 [Myxococcota bacterium]|jgi:hypothetical protein
MTRPLAVLSALSLLTLSACEPLGCYELLPAEPGQDMRLQQGAWSFDLDQVDYAGSCGAEELEAGDLRLQGSIFYTQGQRLEIEVEGLLLIGAQDGRSIFAEGSEWYDVAVDDEDEDVDPDSDEEQSEGDYRGSQSSNQPGIFVSIDGRIDSPADILGELIIEQNFPGDHCIIQARYTGQYRGDVAEAQPDNGDAPVGSQGEDTDAD